MTLVAIGGVAGTALAAAAAVPLAGFLYGVSPLDPFTFTAIAALLGGVALLSARLPARRAE